MKRERKSEEPKNIITLRFEDGTYQILGEKPVSPINVPRKNKEVRTLVGIEISNMEQNLPPPILYITNENGPVGYTPSSSLHHENYYTLHQPTSCDELTLEFDGCETFTSTTVREFYRNKQVSRVISRLHLETK